jgi:DNA-binding transcriptional ArsR family regulator
MLAALGSETRLKVLRLLLREHPDGLVVSQINEELGGSASTLSHHLEKLKHESLISVEKEGTFLRYRANASVLTELLGFILAECCSRNQVIDPDALMACATSSGQDCK